MSSYVVRANARDLPLPDASVDLIVTSPPYYALRSYQDDGEHYTGQIGDEPNPRAYVAALVECTREWARVLKPGGSIFVNLGDKYSANWNSSRPSGGAGLREDGRTRETRTMGFNGQPLPPKTLLGLPGRYSNAVVDEVGLLLRAEVVWSKPNGLPESVQDRVRRSHEHWFHFTREPRYYSATDEIREAYDPATAKRYALGYRANGAREAAQLTTGYSKGDGGPAETNPLGKLPGSVWEIPTEPLKVPEISPLDGRPLPDHFAAFPTEWPRRLILGWSPAGICVECGEGRRPISGKAEWWEAYKAEHGLGDYLVGNYTAGEGYDPAHGRSRATTKVRIPPGPKAAILGYACGCNEPIATPLGSTAGDDPSIETGRGGFNRPRGDDAGVRVITRWEQRHYADQLRAHPQRDALRVIAGPDAFDHYVRTDRAGARPMPPALLAEWLTDGILSPPPAYVPAATRPAVVIDPFGGTGTVALVADMLGRVGISFDLSHDYGRLARWRTTDPGERARALRVEKPPVQVADQESLW